MLYRRFSIPHARLPCPSLSPEVYSNSRPLSRWCHRTISSSVTPFASCPLSFQAVVFCFFPNGSLYQVMKISGFKLQLDEYSFKWIFSIEFPLGLTGLTFLLSKDSQESYPAQLEAINLVLNLPYSPALISIGLPWYLSW